LFLALPAVTGSYRQLPAVTNSYRQLPAVTGSYRQLPAITGNYRQLPAVTGSYRQLPAVTGARFANPPNRRQLQVPCAVTNNRGNWFHIIFWQIVLEAAQIWRKKNSHYFSVDCFGSCSELVGTGSTLFSGGLFWRQLRRIVLGSISFRLKKFFWRLF
jgi:hypothetical protein